MQVLLEVDKRPSYWLALFPIPLVSLISLVSLVLLQFMPELVPGCL